MNYAEILRVLCQEPLAITPAAHASWLSRFEAFLEWRSAEREPGEGPSGEIILREQAEVAEGVMMLPVKGPVGRGLGKVEKGVGCVDFSEIIADLDELEIDPNIRACVIDWDSPGGMVQGGLAVENRILACDKPIYSYSEGMMCSQAYRLACCTDGIFTTADADVGSVGVYCYMLDSSKRYADAGLKPVVIKSGPFKSMGAPGTSFTKEQIELLQAQVDELAEEFYYRVEEMRPGVSREDMQGQSFRGKTAMQKGFVDGIVNDIGDVAAML